MKLPVLLVLTSVALLLGGCSSMPVQQLPELSLRCVVIDHVTRRPIAGARVSIVDRPGNDRLDAFYYGPFVSNAAGEAWVVVKKRTAELNGNEPYFRTAEVEAHGYGVRAFDLEAVKARAATTGTYMFDLFPQKAPPLRRLRMPAKTITSWRSSTGQQAG